MKQIVKPKQLKIGDKVAIVSLSSGILGEPDTKIQLDLGIRRLTLMGLLPVFMPNTLKGIQFIKDNPKARADDLIKAFADDEIKAIICAIGGDDTYKTIPYLMADDHFKKAVQNNPKIFIGFSDSTNNHWLLNQLGLATYYGLNFLSDWCELETQMLTYSKASYELFFQNEPKIEIKPSPTWFENRTSYGDDQLGIPLNAHEEKRGYEVLYGKGNIRGKFWGGCLESIYDIYTSSRYPDQKKLYDDYKLIPDQSYFKDKLIFLETSEEKPDPELFEKMIDVLIKENVLTHANALIVGKPYDEVHYEAYKKILIKIGKKLKLPILYNVNVGHALPRAMLPIGLNGEIDLNNKKLFITESLFSA